MKSIGEMIAPHEMSQSCTKSCGATKQVRSQ
jgi:hypothetical protein